MGILCGSLFVWVTALGGGIFGQHGIWFNQWQHKLFAFLCHQDPGRSFWIGGTPMAVCSRCFGIYTGFLLGWFLFPLMESSMVVLNAYSKKVLAGAFILNIIDVIGNVLDIWQNTLGSRFLLGFLLGGAVVFVLGYEFIRSTININGLTHGTDRTVY